MSSAKPRSLPPGSSAGLLLRSFAQILKVDPGFRPEGVLTLRVALPDAVYSKPEQVRGFYNGLLDRVHNCPAFVRGRRFRPAVERTGSSGTTTIDTQSVPVEDTTPEADQRVVARDYFKAMGISLVRGRFFEPRDSDTAPQVAIIDETLAQTYWPNQDPIGKRLHRGGVIPAPGPRSSALSATFATALSKLARASRSTGPRIRSPSGMTLAILTSGNPMNLAPTIQREVSAIDPDLPVYRVRTMTEVMGDHSSAGGWR